MCVYRCKYSANVRVGQGIEENMDGYYTTYNESASGVTAPRTVFETRQRDTRNAISATQEADGKSHE